MRRKPTIYYPEIVYTGKDQWRILHDYDIYVAQVDKLVIVRRGFLTDGASVPRFFWRLIGPPMEGDYLPAAIIHDALYASESLPRAKCDHIFLLLLKRCQIPAWKRYCMYFAVRLGGGMVWRKHTPESVAEARKLVEVR